MSDPMMLVSQEVNILFEVCPDAQGRGQPLTHREAEPVGCLFRHRWDLHWRLADPSHQCPDALIVANI